MTNKKFTVIIPQNASELECYAAEELAFFLKEINATECVTVREKEYDFNGEPFIALGETELFKKDSDSESLLKAVGEDGYKIVVSDSCACGRCLTTSTKSRWPWSTASSTPIWRPCSWPPARSIPT